MGTNTNETMISHGGSTEASSSRRLPYRAPRLQRFGSVARLTQGTSRKNGEASKTKF